ncbi:hypothetical protein B0H19DRAFT_457546 [Mycena capillaripes]|nr:hypothetical protein B0H19DRAFT_457546 [Mycena capillaripes]
MQFAETNQLRAPPSSCILLGLSSHSSWVLNSKPTFSEPNFMPCLLLNFNSPLTNLGLFNTGGRKSSEAKAYDQFFSGKIRKSNISSELLARAASFAATREFEKHCEVNGRPQSHAEARDLLAGFAGAFIDKEVETRELDSIDKDKAKYDASSSSVLAYARNRPLSRLNA